MPAGQIFGYQDLPGYERSTSAVIKAVGRLVTEKRLERFSKGKFYVPKEGMFGLRKPSDGELIRSISSHKGLWEVRANQSNGRSARVFFCAHKEEMILLHGIIKKSQKAPKHELDLAVKRMKGLK